MNRLVSALAVASLLLAFGSTSAGAQQNDFAAPHVANQIIVGWKQPIPPPRRATHGSPGIGAGTTSRDPGAIRFTNAIDLLKTVDLHLVNVLLGGRAWLVESNGSVPTAELARRAAKLRDQEIVTFATANHLVEFQQSSSPPVNDPLYPSQTHLQKIDVEGAWTITSGSPDIVVAIVDTGVQIDHPDIAQSLWVNPCEDLNGNGRIDGTDVNGVDDACSGTSTGNGHIDDFNGWNFGGDNGNLADGGLHGTHVAGIVAAARDNGVGVAGIADVKIAVIKTTNGTASNVAHVVDGFTYAIESGFPVATASFTTTYNAALEIAMQDAGAAGMIVVAAAGNEGKDLDSSSNNVYPASFGMDHVIAVAAATDLDQRKSDSNHGSTVVEIAAPGVGVLSTLPPNDYQAKDGSSIAAPQVAGVIALILAANPTASVSQVRSCLAQGDAAMTGETVWGVRLNARKAVEACAPTSSPGSLGRPPPPTLLDGA